MWEERVRDGSHRSRPLMTAIKEQVLAILTERNIELPDDGMTLKKIRHRGTRFRIDEGEFLSFQLERHPTMYLSDSQFGGFRRSPA